MNPHPSHPHGAGGHPGPQPHGTAPHHPAYPQAQPQHQPVHDGPQPAPGTAPQPQQDYSQPVAYDTQGRPLYLHPQQQMPQAPQQPQMVYLARPVQPQSVEIAPEVIARHEESRKKFPNLNLSDGEYVISAVRRHPIGLLRIWIVVAALIVGFGLMASFVIAGGTLVGAGATSYVVALLLVLYMLFILGGLAATYVYENNRFYLTNESVIQEIQTSLFDKHEQTVSLANIEDASYKQGNIVQAMFNYGSIRLSTEGDETTYRFDYVAGPKKHIATLNNAVEAFKNGRPVD